MGRSCECLCDFGYGVAVCAHAIVYVISNAFFPNAFFISFRSSPAISFGTYKVGFIPASASSAVAAGATEVQRTAEECVSDALSVGYRSLECAEFYGNEAEVGKAIAKSGIPRGELYLCSKVWTTTIEKGEDAIRAQLDTEVQRTAEECVSDALSVGYRSLECAEFYGNEAEVGKAIAKSGIPRGELYLCSKVWTTTIEKGEDAIRAQLDKTLSDFGTDYVDLYLVHWPVPGKHVDAYKTLEKLCKEGKCKSIGLSNYAVEDYIELKESGIEILPAINQIEINPFLYRKNTLDFFTKEGVVLQSYRSLRDGKAFGDETVVRIANAKGKTPAQILGRWCVQKGYVYMPKSVKKERMIENGKVFEWALSADEMAELDSLTKPEAYTTFEELYRKCVNRDTSKDGTMDGVKMSITKD